MTAQPRPRPSAEDPLAPDPAHAAPGDVIDHILSRYHAAHRRDLPELIRLAERVETAHRDDEAAPRGLAALLTTLHGDLTRHMMKEEIVVFPRIRRAVATPLDRPLAEIAAEHDAHGETLATIRRMTGGFAPPDHACSSWRTLYAGLAAFAADLEAHVATETRFLFPRSGD